MKRYDLRQILVPLNADEVLELNGLPHLNLTAHGAFCLRQILERKIQQERIAAQQQQRPPVPNFRPQPPRKPKLSQCSALALVEQLGPVTLNELVEIFGSKKIYVIRTLRRLEREGFVTSLSDERFVSASKVERISA